MRTLQPTYSYEFRKIFSPVNPYFTWENNKYLKTPEKGMHESSTHKKTKKRENSLKPKKNKIWMEETQRYYYSKKKKMNGKKKMIHVSDFIY